MAAQTIDRCTSLSMTVDTPTHLHRRNPLHHIHLGDLTVTFLTRDPGFNMALMGELHVIRHHVDLHPIDRLVRRVRLMNLLYLRLRGIILSGDHIPMAPHTGLNLWNCSKRGFCNRPMAILTIHFVLLNVDNVTEINRLFRLISARALRRSEIVEMIGYIEVPQCSLTIVEHARPYADRRIRRGRRC